MQMQCLVLACHACPTDEHLIETVRVDHLHRIATLPQEYCDWITYMMQQLMHVPY